MGARRAQASAPTAPEKRGPELRMNFRRLNKREVDVLIAGFAQLWARELAATHIERDAEGHR